MISRKRRILCFVFVAVWAALSGWGAARAGEGAQVVKVHLPGYSTNSLPYFIAEEMGFYRDEGIRAEIVRIRTGAGIQALVAGAVDASQIVGPTLLAAILGGAPLKIAMVFNDRPTYTLYVKNGLKSFGDLKGAKIGSSTPGSTNDRLLKIVLEKNGINWKKDLTIIYIGSSDVVLKALQSGSIDGAALTPPASFLAEQFGFHPLASFINEVGALQGGVSTSDGFLRERRNVAERFLRATLRGLRTFKSNRDATVKVMTKFMDLPKELAARVYDANQPVFVSDGLLSEEFQDKVLDFELKTIGSEKKIGREKVFDFSIVKSLGSR